MRSLSLIALIVLSACTPKASDSAATGATPPTPPDESDETEDSEPAEDSADTGSFSSGVFAEGCPEEGRALARRIGTDASLPGDVAVGTEGDLLLANAVAAFVITEPDKGSTYYHYGGIVADAAPVSGCVAGQDQLDEVGLILARIDVFDTSQSIVRAFRGETAEVLSDGSDGGPAIVRVHGVDDHYWLVEYELIGEAAASGSYRPVSAPFGVELSVDYILEPDRPVLRIELNIHNTGAADLSLITGALLSFAPNLDLHSFASSGLELGGLSLSTDIPWLLATDGAHSLAYSVQEGSLAYTGISGIEVALDSAQLLLDPLELPPGGSDQARSLLSVSGGGGGTATAPLHGFEDEPIPGNAYTPSLVQGSVLDPTGAAVAEARVAVEASVDGLGWATLTEATSQADGSFSAPVPLFDDPLQLRLVARADGRDPSPPVEASAGDSGVELLPSTAGALSYSLLDDRGDPSPARIALDRSDGLRVDEWLAGSGEIPVAPGSYDYTLTRGYEYAPVYGSLEVPEAGTASLSATLSHIVDTTGWMSADSHVHSAQSPDSRVPAAEQLLHAAAHGLEVVIHTEHEHIPDLRGLPEEVELQDWLTNVLGEEVTASIPEHLTMFPVEPDGSARGGIVEWYQLDIEQLYEAMRERSDGGVNLLNHPSYLDLIEWDPVRAEPGLEDPVLLGLAPDAALWSWNFDGIEVMNGHASPFDNNRWRDWQSFLNAGHAIAAVGVSDDHGGDQTGFPRTYFAAPTDEPASMELEDLTSAYFSGQLIASAGAFARVSIGEAGLGELADGSGGQVELEVLLEAMPEADLSHFVVFSSCDTVARVAVQQPDGVLKHEGSVAIEVEGDTQITLAAFGSNALPAGLPQYDATRTPRVLTNPIYVDGDGDGLYSAPGGRDCQVDLAAP